MSELITRELHVCMGLNSCKNAGYSENNDCAGKGDCSTAVGHPCHTLNSCKSQGGCGIFGTTEELCHPGENDCRYQGSCGVPILSSRFMAQGPNKGLSVWQLARARFEEKRQKNGESFGEAPQQYGPSEDYVNTVRGTTGQDYSSCGQSGSRSCSYINNPAERQTAAAARVLKMEEESAKKLPETISNCCSKNNDH
ncbi:hypothetical protein GKZ90_0004765 [Flavobacterium sp. MC2016-06]|jgi:hypothetical protein|uniref:hypothetical protein n=1 Tax=Flavobacterium sp. MC2016-06 TaxID=2676308 RepID=UPI0012BA937A|nr:hypothetical protein [Flavobacterium sp. MC2016-06]MBU3858898.1 hypothetical protein [Flavobacterium sp. MC2016-06]